MRNQEENRPIMASELDRLERKIMTLVEIAVAVLLGIAACLGWYLPDMKSDIREDIQSDRRATFAMIDRVRAESIERDNELREDLGKQRIEYDPLPPPGS